MYDDDTRDWDDHLDPEDRAIIMGRTRAALGLAPRMILTPIHTPTRARVLTTNGGDAVVIVHHWSGPTYAALCESLSIDGEPTGHTYWVDQHRLAKIEEAA